MPKQVPMDEIHAYLQAAGGEIADRSGLASRQLADALGFTTSLVSDRLRRLEAQGLITRESEGKRTFRISLTEEGLERDLDHVELPSDALVPYPDEEGTDDADDEEPAEEVEGPSEAEHEEAGGHGAAGSDGAREDASVPGAVAETPGLDELRARYVAVLIERLEGLERDDVDADLCDRIERLLGVG